MQGIYRITNTANGKVYIGSSCDIRKRWNSHRSLLWRGIHHNLHLQRAWNKYGADVFIFEVLEEVVETVALIEREQVWLDTIGGQAGEVYNFGKCADSPLRGRPRSKETKAKLRAANTGYKHTEEARRKISEATRGAKNPNYGKKVSEETKLKISKAQMGNKYGLGRSLSKEHCRKIGEANKKRVVSDETRRKIGEASSKPYPAFVHEETGKVIPSGVGLSKVCREHGLTRGCMHRILIGERTHHRGWRLLNA